jgi:uncharacterized repeat protein (TIGR03803 family)
MKHLASTLCLLSALVLCGCGGGGTYALPPGSPPAPPPGPPPPPPPPPPAGYTVLHTFKGGAEGERPYSLIGDEAGNLYGTTGEGGDLSCPDDVNGCGTVFKLDPSGALTTLHVFHGAPTDGVTPQEGLIRDAAGNIYGATFSGGAHGFGILYKLDVTGSETVLYQFTGGADGAFPEVGFQDVAGNLYGTTGFNGQFVKCSHDCGTVFKLDATGNLTTLYTFSGLDGDTPSTGPLIVDAAGNLYGTTAYGGSAPTCIHPLGCGTVFKLDPSGMLTTLHAFVGHEVEGEVPTGRLSRDEAGNLYGTTIGGGGDLGGTVFKVDANGQMTTLHAFVSAPGGEDGNDPGGQNPQGGVLLGATGNLYGTTQAGGVSEWGVLFEMNAESGQETVLNSFTQAGGGGPQGPLVLDSAGNLYGTGAVGGDLTCQPPAGCGIVFKMKLP